MTKLEIAKNEFICTIINNKKERLKKELSFEYNYAKEIGLEETFVLLDGLMELPTPFKPIKRVFNLNNDNIIYKPQIGRSS